MTREPTRLIDTDVHNHVGNVNKYLPKMWKNRSIDLSTGFHSTVGVSRRDATPDRGGAPGSDPEFLIKDHLDRYQIDYAILNVGGKLGLSVHPDPDLGNAMATAVNDCMIEEWLPYSPRFKGSLLVNASDPAAAVKEIERVGGHPDMVQVIIASAALFPYGQRFYHPIYEAAEHYGLPIAIHPGTEGKGVSRAPTPSGHPTRYMEWHNILPINYMTHVNSLICEGVFEKFPKLTFIAIEGGFAWLPHLIWRMDKNYKALRDTTPWLKRLPSEYVMDHIKLTTQPIEEPQNKQDLLDILRMINAGQTLMYSSDYPHWDFDHPDLALPPLDPELRHRIYAGTAADLYGLHFKPEMTNKSTVPPSSHDPNAPQPRGEEDE